ncbi:shkC [Acrasis kona]|uniref:ShkC n=1 Tax=Acrasis kona TaxID=1008807 RepID=A0AAW2Z4D1_9EUKA
MRWTFSVIVFIIVLVENSDTKYYNYATGSNVLFRDDGQKKEEVYFQSGQTIKSYGYRFTLTEDGQLYSIGKSNERGQLGTNSYVHDYYGTVRVVNMPYGSFVTSFCEGPLHSAAVTKQGEVYTWGDNTKGQLGLGKYSMIEKLPTPTKLQLHNIISVACSGKSTFALSATGKLYGWGEMIPNVVVKDPTLIESFKSLISDVQTDFYSSSVVIMSDGDVHKLNSTGYFDQLTFQTQPEKIMSVDMFNNVIAAVSYTNSLYVWDVRTNVFQLQSWVSPHTVQSALINRCINSTLTCIIVLLKNGTVLQTQYTGEEHTHSVNMVFTDSVTEFVSTNIDIKTIDKGRPVISSIMVKQTDGKVYTHSSDNDFFRLPLDDCIASMAFCDNLDSPVLILSNQSEVHHWDFKTKPQKISTSSPILSISRFQMMLTSDKCVLTLNGKICSDSTRNFVKIQSQTNMFAAITKNSKLYFSTNLNTSLSSEFVYPDLIAFENEDIVDVCLGSHHAVVLTNKNHIYTFGDNFAGQLGTKTIESLYNFALIDTGVDFKSIDCNYNSTIAISTNGEIYYWGRFGSQGINFTTQLDIPITTPTKVSTAGIKFKSISTGIDHAVAVSEDDKVYVYGHNYYGQFGNKVIKSSDIFIQINNIPERKAVLSAFALFYDTYISMTCKDYYEGHDCEIWYCDNILYSKKESCQVGKCVSPNTCLCPKGYQNHGGRCLPICYNKYLGTACSGSGTCVSPNHCKCSPNYRGSECDIYECNGITSGSERVCSGNGVCFSPNNCTCNNDRWGHDCELYGCYGVSYKNETVVCSGHGRCVSSNNCTCEPNRSGPKCEYYYCYGVLYSNELVCNGNGVCVDYDKCVCNSFYLSFAACRWPIPAVATGALALVFVLIISIIVLIKAIKHVKKIRKQQLVHEKISFELERKINTLTGELEKTSDSWMIQEKDLYFGDKIAEGTHGKVFKGRYMKKPVAIKVIKSYHDGDTHDGSYSNVIAEVAILKSLHHQNIVQFYGVCITKETNTTLIVTEFMEGLSLEHIIIPRNRECTLTFEKKLTILLDVALDSSVSIAKVADFGVSKYRSSGGTLSLVSVGTPNYMSPEAMMGNFDESCDVYSFGIVMYEVLFNKQAYNEHKSLFSFYEEVKRGERPLVPSSNFFTSNETMTYIELMKQCWSHQKHERPSFGEVTERIEALIKDVEYSDVY